MPLGGNPRRTHCGGSGTAITNMDNIRMWAMVWAMAGVDTGICNECGYVDVCNKPKVCMCGPDRNKRVYIVCNKTNTIGVPFRRLVHRME